MTDLFGADIELPYYDLVERSASKACGWSRSRAWADQVSSGHELVPRRQPRWRQAVGRGDPGRRAIRPRADPGPADRWIEGGILAHGAI